MSYPVVEKLLWPIDPYRLSDELWQFGDRVPRRFGLPAIHLGDDVAVPAGTLVQAIGAGAVVFAKLLPGSQDHRSWGGVVIIGHRAAERDFYSVSGHLRELTVRVGDVVAAGQHVGEVAASYTPENGWWKIPHLHFAIYTGPWRGEILPGYWRPEYFWRTRRAWWHKPHDFITRHNLAAASD